MQKTDELIHLAFSEKQLRLLRTGMRRRLVKGVALDHSGPKQEGSHSYFYLPKSKLTGLIPIPIPLFALPASSAGEQKSRNPEKICRNSLPYHEKTEVAACPFEQAL